ncbi:MAG: Rrf2 family transcriptional regulator [Acidobacteriota bacterium]
MLFSKATGYGIRAMVYLAGQPGNQPCGLKEIAEQEKIPPVFLRKVLGELCHRRLLLSVKGIHGGYMLGRPPEAITVWDVIRSLEAGQDFDSCILGCGVCNPEHPCVLHSDWQRLREELMISWQVKTISELASLQSEVPPRPTSEQARRTTDGERQEVTSRP